MISSLLVVLLFSVGVVGGAHAHPSAIRQRTLEDRDTPACPLSLQPGSLCDVNTEKGNKCGFDYVYMGDCDATKEELECLPEMTCTCDKLMDGTWACPQFRRRDAMIAEMMPTCPDNGTTVADERGEICTPPSQTSSGSATADDETLLASPPTTSAAASSAASTSSGSATADDGATYSPSKNAVDTDNSIDSVEVTTSAVVVDNESSTTITVKEGESESDGAMSSLSSSSSQHQGLEVGKVTMVAVATATAGGIALFL